MGEGPPPRPPGAPGGTDDRARRPGGGTYPVQGGGSPAARPERSPRTPPQPRPLRGEAYYARSRPSPRGALLAVLAALVLTFVVLMHFIVVSYRPLEPPEADPVDNAPADAR